MTIAEEDTEERDSITGNDSHQKPSQDFEIFGREYAGVEPKNGDLAKSGRNNPSHTNREQYLKLRAKLLLHVWRV